MQLKVINGQSSGTACANPQVEHVKALEKQKKSKKKRRQRSSGSKQPKPENKEMFKCCEHCGRSHIKQRIQCPAFGKTCAACGKPNHFAEMCRISGRKDCSRNGINVVDPDDSSSEELLSVSFDRTEENANSINEDTSPETKIFASMEIEGKVVRMQIATGASCNVLPQKFVPPGTHISKTERTLKMYSKSTLPVLGTCRLSMRNPKHRKKYNAKILVV